MLASTKKSDGETPRWRLQIQNCCFFSLPPICLQSYFHAVTSFQLYIRNYSESCAILLFVTSIAFSSTSASRVCSVWCLCCHLLMMAEMYLHHWVTHGGIESVHYFISNTGLHIVKKHLIYVNLQTRVNAIKWESANRGKKSHPYFSPASLYILLLLYLLCARIKIHVIIPTGDQIPFISATQSALPVAVSHS